MESSITKSEMEDGVLLSGIPTTEISNKNNCIDNINDIKLMTEEIVSLYDSSITSVSSLMNRIYDTIDNSEHEDEELKEKLKNSLAKKLTLRKKDFDSLFNDAFSIPSMENRIELKKKIDDFINEHTKSVAMLKKQIIDRKKIRHEEFRELFDKIKKRQREREEEVKNMITDFQTQHQKMISDLREFLTEDRAIRLRDLKKLMNKCKKEREMRRKENDERAKRWRKVN